MATIGDYMTRDVIVLSPRTSVHQALSLLLANDISGAPVVDERGEVVGMLTGRDVLGAIYDASYHQDLGGPVSAYMARDVRSVDVDADVMEVIELFLKTPFRRFPVMRGTRLVGLISRRDVMRAIQRLW